MHIIPLAEVCEYSVAATSVSNLNLSTYVTTDNLLPNRGGIVDATNLPPAKTCPKFERDNILLSNIRPYFKKIWYATFEGGCSTDVMVLKCKNDKYYPKFVYYSLFQDLFFRHMMNGAKGSKMPRGDKDQIMEFQIPDLDKPVQIKIADILSSLDAKISLNNRINAELEQLARTLYNYWFVQFDFPISATQAAAMGKPELQGKPYKTSGGAMVWNEELKREVPGGWEVGRLEEFANITTGKLDSNQVIEKGKYPFFTCAPEPLSIDTFAFDDSVILIAGNNASGNFHINRFKGKFNAYQRTYVVTSKSHFGLDYLYYALRLELKNLKDKGQGSQTKFLTMSILNEIWIYRIKEEVLRKFNDIINPLFEKQNTITMENQELTRLRDFLLPLLMNGEVTLKC